VTWESEEIEDIIKKSFRFVITVGDVEGTESYFLTMMELSITRT
jgi:hypothetical protein